MCFSRESVARGIYNGLSTSLQRRVAELTSLFHIIRSQSWHGVFFKKSFEERERKRTKTTLHRAASMLQIPRCRSQLGENRVFFKNLLKKEKTSSTTLQRAASMFDIFGLYAEFNLERIELCTTNLLRNEKSFSTVNMLHTHQKEEDPFKEKKN